MLIPKLMIKSEQRDRNYPEGSRLFVVLIGPTLPEYVLYELFSPYGDLEFVKLQKDKTYGNFDILSR